MTTWKRQGQFVSDCTETLGKMYAVRSESGAFVGAFDRKEDATLGSCAPALLAELKRLVRLLEVEDAHLANFGEVEAARAAIAQAEGRADV